MAIYTLNQKRRELARIETEYGMEVSFEPKEGLMAGHFELDRTRTRDPEDRPRNHAVSIEAGFVPSDEPEDDTADGGRRRGIRRRGRERDRSRWRGCRRAAASARW